MVYVVEVLFSGGHGDESAVALVTEDLIKAVDTAKDIEKLGYTLGRENGAMVQQLEPERVYEKSAFRYHGTRPPPGYPTVFWRGKGRKGEVIEDWFDENSRRVYLRAA